MLLRLYMKNIRSYVVSNLAMLPLMIWKIRPHYFNATVSLHNGTEFILLHCNGSFHRYFTFSGSSNCEQSLLIRISDLSQPPCAFQPKHPLQVYYAMFRSLIPPPPTLATCHPPSLIQARPDGNSSSWHSLHWWMGGTARLAGSIASPTIRNHIAIACTPSACALLWPTGNNGPLFRMYFVSTCSQPCTLSHSDYDFV